MKTALILLLVGVAAITASEVKKVVETKVSYGTEKGYGATPDGYKFDAGYTYHGKYGGACGNDGFYFNDASSFVICSNGNAYIQPCAPGSKNSAYNHYQYGNSYYYRDFCDINLVDDGYTLRHGYNEGYKAPTYGHGYNNGYNAGYGYGGYGGYNPGYNTGYSTGYNDGYGYNAGYGYNSGYNGGHGYNGYGYNGGYGSGYGYGGYPDKSYGGSYQRTEYSYNQPAKGYGH